jgi:hypothetical protein
MVKLPVASYGGDPVASYGGDDACQFYVAAAGDWACTLQFERMGASTVRCRGAQRKIRVYWAWIYRSGAARHSANALRRFVFDGAGKLTGKQSSSRGGKIGREKLEGSYTLDADCTGTLTLGGILAGQTHWDLYVTEDRKRGHIIRMDEGNMAVRSFER